MTQPVRVERDGEMAVVTIDAPPLNLYDTAMAAALEAAIAELETTHPRAVLFQAAGKTVSAGVDVRMFDALQSQHEATVLFSGMVQLARRVAALNCPTVFAAHGLCLTWAFELALACDLIVAAESASFGLIEATVGLTPAMGGTQRLAERAGPARARELVLTADRFDAATMERWNVINRVLPDEDFSSVALSFTRSLAAGPTRAHAATKAALRQYSHGGIEAANDAVPALAGSLFDTADLRGALATFLAEGPGKATFEGR